MTRKEKNLMLAAVEGDVKRIERLLAPNVDPSLIFFNGWSLLHIAAHYDQFDLAQWLLGRNVDSNTPNLHKASALHVCTYVGSESVTGLLVDARARMDEPDANGWLPLGIAAWHGFINIVDRLVRGGCEISQRGASGQTALHYAAWNNYTDVVELLVSSGANTNIGNDDGFTPVDLAWQNQSLESLRILSPQKYESLLDHVQKVWGTHSASIIPRRISQNTLDFVSNALLETDQENYLSSNRKVRERTYSHITLSGIAVASRSEVTIANMLHSLRIPFEYKGTSSNQAILRQVRPSFLFKSSGGSELAWDHIERNHEEDFDGYLAQRIQRFVNAGFKLGESYLVSFDNANGSFDSTRIRSYINTISHKIRVNEARQQLRSDQHNKLAGVTRSNAPGPDDPNASGRELPAFVEDREAASGMLSTVSSMSAQLVNAGAKAPGAPSPGSPPPAPQANDEAASEPVEAEVIPAERNPDASLSSLLQAATAADNPPRAGGGSANPVVHGRFTD